MTNAAVASLSRASRLKVFQPVQVVARSQGMRAHLLNLSHTGGMIHCPDSLEQGSIVEIDLCGTNHAARVVWVNGKRYGVAFMTKLLSRQIDDVLQAANDLAKLVPPEPCRTSSGAAC